MRVPTEKENVMKLGRANLSRRAREYLYRDDFRLPVAVGSVNNSTCVPGPGMRTVVDTGNLLSVTAAGLVAAGGMGAYGNPGLWLPALTRRAGLIGLLSLNFDQTNKDSFAGWDTSQAGFPPSGIRIDFNSSAQMGLAGGIGVIENYVAATTYQFALVLRATGMFAFVRGGAFTIWTLIGYAKIESTATLYLGVQNYDAAFTVTGLRVARDLWQPVPMVSDSFNRLDGALGNTDGQAHPEANGGQGLTWQETIGTWAISTNQAQATALDGGVAFASLSVPEVNGFTLVGFTRSAGTGGPVVRYADTNNYVRAIHNGTNCQLIKRVGGVETPVIDVVKAYVVGAPIEIVHTATKFALFYNDAKVGTDVTIADAGLQTGTSIGVYTDNLGNTFDGFVSWGRGTVNQYEGLLNSF